MELTAYIEAMNAIRAERLLDAAQVAAYPLHLQHAPRQAQDWWRRLLSDAQDTIAPLRETARRGARFTWNGAAVGFTELRSKLAAALGGGLSA